jgi:hypothetical protein
MNEPQCCIQYAKDFIKIQLELIANPPPKYIPPTPLEELNDVTAHTSKDRMKEILEQNGIKIKGWYKFKKPECFNKLVIERDILNQTNK